MNVTASSRNWGTNFVVLAGLVLTLATTSQAVPITINNTSSSYIQIRDESDSNNIVTNLTGGIGTYVVDMPDNHNFRFYPGQVGDQGSHYLKIVGGQINYDPGNPGTAFFNNTTPTSLTIGSIPVHFRLLSGADNSLVSAGFEIYFPIQSMTVGTDRIVNLVPSDGFFVGNWKNTFPYSFVQQTPFQLRASGIQSMTGDGGSMGTIVPSSLVYTNFVEGGIGYGGFRFTVDRLDGAQAGDGSQWLFFTVPEPSTLALLGLGGLVLRRRFSR